MCYIPFPCSKDPADANTWPFVGKGLRMHRVGDNLVAVFSWLLSLESAKCVGGIWYFWDNGHWSEYSKPVTRRREHIKVVSYPLRFVGSNPNWTRDKCKRAGCRVHWKRSYFCECFLNSRYWDIPCPGRREWGVTICPPCWHHQRGTEHPPVGVEATYIALPQPCAWHVFIFVVWRVFDHEPANVAPPQKSKTVSVPHAATLLIILYFKSALQFW